MKKRSKKNHDGFKLGQNLISHTFSLVFFIDLLARMLKGNILASDYMKTTQNKIQMHTFCQKTIFSGYLGMLTTFFHPLKTMYFVTWGRYFIFSDKNVPF